MPTPTYVALAKTVLSSNTTTVNINTIPSTYTDLVLVVSARCSGSVYVGDLQIQVNGFSSGMSTTQLRGNSSAVSSFRDSSQFFWNLYSFVSGASATSNTFSSIELYLPNYAGSTAKPMSATGVSETNSSTAGQSAVNTTASLWNNTGAISAINLSLSTGGDFVSGSRFDLYGIKNS